MPNFEYFLIERTSLSVCIEAKDREEADQKIEEMLSGGDLDWGMGDMEIYSEFNEENENA